MSFFQNWITRLVTNFCFWILTAWKSKWFVALSSKIPILKMRSVPWSEKMLTAGFRSFQRGIVGLCRSNGCKLVVGQTLRMIPLSRTAHGAKQQDFFPISYLTSCSFASLWSTETQNNSLEDLNYAVNILSHHQTDSIFKRDIPPSNWPYFNIVYH